MLDEERKFFDANRDTLVSQHVGMFVLIKNAELIGTYNTIDEALVEGARRFGMQPFLVRQVTTMPDSEINIPALTLGILRADTTRSV
jgi:hypothetical protein